jgi:hypothetical protein
MPAAKKAGAQGNAVKKRPPTRHVELPKVDLLQDAELPNPDSVEEQAKSPYPPGVLVFEYQPNDGSDPIPLAMNGFKTPDKVWHFDVAQMPILSQTWEWMKRANIPKDIQRRAQMLPDAEYFGMFDKWFDAMKVAQKGALSSGK